jgi:hypothetical protein
MDVQALKAVGFFNALGGGVRADYHAIDTRIAI